MNKSIILLLIAISSGFALHAQKATKDTIIRRDMVLEKEYQPEVVTSERMILLPELEKISAGKKQPIFSLTGNPARIKGEYLPLPAPELKAEYPAQDQLGYFSLGAGSKLSFFADGQLNLIRKPKQALDIRLMHSSIFGDITNTMNVNSRAYNNNNRIMANYKLHLPGNELTVGLSEKYNAWNYYGTWQNPLTAIGDAYPNVPGGQWLSDTKFSAGFKSKNLNQAFTWNIGAESHIFRLGRGIPAPLTTDKVKGGRENELHIKAILNYDISENFHIGLDGQILQFSYRSPDSYSLDETFYNDQATYFKKQNWIVVNPYARWTYKKWEIKTGLKVTVPSLETQKVKYNLTASATTSINDKASFRLSVDGGMLPVSYREGFEMNQYLDPSIRIMPLWKPIGISAGIDYRPIKSLRISPVLEYERVNNMPFFYNGYPSPSEYINQTYGHLFSVKYMKSNRISIGADVLYNYRNKLTISGNARYNQYVNYSDDATVDAQLDVNGRKAWYNPALEIQCRLDYKPVEKISLFAGYQIFAMRYAATPDAFSAKLDDINDLNIGVIWMMAKDVNVFFKLDNMLDQRYDIWNGYRVHGFSAMVGGSVSF